jgi:putative addiction module antidote
MERKIFKTGNSLVISLPRESLLNLGLQEGSEVQVTVDEESGRIIIEPLRHTLADIDPTFARQLDDFIDRYRPALEALAK